ncbi:MAG: zinc metalloprotease HtpX [Flavobacteriaceae bacterium]
MDTRTASHAAVISAGNGHRLLNTLHTVLLVGGALALLAVTAWVYAGTTGILWALVLGGVIVWMARRVSPALILRLYKAEPLPPSIFPEGPALVRDLASRAGLPAVPELYYVKSSMMNAFAVGKPENAAICVTDGLLRGLTLRQLAGVLAHEISHVSHRDLNVMAIADAVSRLTSVMSTIGILTLFINLPLMMAGAETFPLLGALVLIAAPTVGSLLQLALSRTREYDADLGAAALTGDPVGLASALTVLEKKQGRVWEMALPGGRIPEPSVLRTHPLTADRVARLKALAGGRFASEPTPPAHWHAHGRPRVTSVPVVRPPRVRLSAMGLYY